MTGNIETYLLFKELEKEEKKHLNDEADNCVMEEFDSTVH